MFFKILPDASGFSNIFYKKALTVVKKASRM